MEVMRRLVVINAISHRSIHTTSISLLKAWREARGLPINKTSAGPLTDLPDYSFLDGRTTPLAGKQKVRAMRQRQLTEMIVDYCNDLDFAKQRQIEIKQRREEEQRRIAERRLKPKGYKLFENN